MNLTKKLQQMGALYTMGAMATAFVAEPENMQTFRAWLKYAKHDNMDAEGVEMLLEHHDAERMTEDLKAASHNFEHLLSHVDELAEGLDTLRDIL